MFMEFFMKFLLVQSKVLKFLFVKHSKTMEILPMSNKFDLFEKNTFSLKYLRNNFDVD